MVLKKRQCDDCTRLKQMEEKKPKKYNYIGENNPVTLQTFHKRTLSKKRPQTFPHFLPPPASPGSFCAGTASGSYCRQQAFTSGLSRKRKHWQQRPHMYCAVPGWWGRGRGAMKGGIEVTRKIWGSTYKHTDKV